MRCKVLMYFTVIWLKSNWNGSIKKIYFYFAFHPDFIVWWDSNISSMFLLLKLIDIFWAWIKLSSCMKIPLFLYGRASSKTVDKTSLDKFFFINSVKSVLRMGCSVLSGVKRNTTDTSLLGSAIKESFWSIHPIKESLFWLPHLTWNLPNLA